MKKIYELVQKNFLGRKINQPHGPQYAAEDKLPLITISRETGSGGRPIAFLVAKTLGERWKVFHKEIVEEMADQTHLEKQLVNEIDERNIPFIEEIIADVFGKRYMTLTAYQKELARILSEIGNRGYAIIVGRGAHNLFPHALKVRVICEMQQRIAWEIEYERLTRSEAIRRINDSDDQRYEFEKAMFGHDLRKAHHYDLVIRTGPQLSIEEAASAIVYLAKQRFKL